MTQLRWVLVVTLTFVAAGARAKDNDFTVDFGQCAEYVGIGQIPPENVSELVPSRYELLLDAETHKALLVVRVVNCGSLAVDGKSAGPARIAQIGVEIESVDPAGDAQAHADATINNYLLWFVTDLGKLHGKLEAAGIANGNDQQLSFMFTPLGATGTLSIDVSAPQFPAYPLQGVVTAPAATPIRFLATWWSDGRHGTVKMRSEFPAIRFGIGPDTDVSLEPAPDSELAALIGSPELEFSDLNSYNEFDSASMNVSSVATP